MQQAQLYQGTWEQIASVAPDLRGRTNLTLIVPIEEEVPDTRTESEIEAARSAAIRAGRGSLACEYSLVEELSAERLSDKRRENMEFLK